MQGESAEGSGPEFAALPPFGPEVQDLERFAARFVPDPVVVVDADLRAVWVSDSVERVLGPRVGRWIGRDVTELVHPEDTASAVGAMAESRRASGYHLPTRLRIAHPDGGWVDARVSANTVEREDGTWVVLAVRPAHEEAAIEERRSRLAALAEHVYLTCAGMRWYEEADLVPPLLAGLSAVVGAVGAEVAGWEEPGGSAEVLAAVGGPDGPTTGDESGRRTEPEHPLSALRAGPCAVTEGADRSVVEVLLSPENGGPGFLRLHLDGPCIWWDDANADLVASAATILLTTVRRCREERWTNEQAIRDPLTRLLNRTALLDRLEAVMDRTTPGYRPPVVLFADLNRFKQLNDTHGHREGDRVLQAVAEAIGSEARPRDLAARIGGDEFVLVFDAPDESAAQIVSRVRTAVDRALSPWPGVSVAVGAISVGPYGTPADVLERADRAMYRDKRRRSDDGPRTGEAP